MLYTHFVPTGRSRWAVLVKSRQVAEVKLGRTPTLTFDRPVSLKELDSISAFMHNSYPKME
jgi:hypothetical protein